MTAPEITFGENDLTVRQRARIRAALRAVPDRGPGAWPDPVEEVEVTRLLAGGLSGAVVAQLTAHHGAHRRVLVAKVDALEELRREWRAYNGLVRPAANALCAPIVAATPDVVGPGAQCAPGAAGALVYDHVAQYAGDPAAELRTLEEVVSAALNGGGDGIDAAVELIRTLFGGIGHVLHNRHRVVGAMRSWRSLNVELGPNLVVRALSTDPGAVVAGTAPADEVLQRTLRGDAEDDLRPGDEVALSGMRRRDPADPRLLLADDVLVRVDQGDPPPEIADATLAGVVTATRGALGRQRLAAAVPDARRFADPFDALPAALLDAARGRVVAISHGDLNPRNVVVAGGRPFLIDYAHTAAERPQQEDYCWLEVGLLRDVLADRGQRALLEVQRVLWLAGRAVDGGATPEQVASSCRDLLPHELRPAFAVLWAIREQAHRHHPADAGEPWWRSHGDQLVIAAHRTLKWDGEVQTPAKLTACAVVAGVAAEWLTGGNPFRWWDGPALLGALRAATVLMPVESDAMVALCAQLVQAAHERAVEDLERLVADYRDQLVRARCTGVASTILADLVEHHRYSEVDPVLDRLVDFPAVELVGEPGIGKSAAVRELVRRMAAAVHRGDRPCRMPLLVEAVPEDLTTAVGALGFGACAEHALALGAVGVLVDDGDHPSGAPWAAEVSADNPRVPVLLCGRRARLASAGFPSVVLRGLDFTEVRAFLHTGLTALGHHSFQVDRLLTRVVDDPSWRHVGLHRPGVLTGLIEHVRATGGVDDLPHPHEVAFGYLPSDEDSRAYCEQLAEHLLDGAAAPDPPSGLLIAGGLLTDTRGRIDFRERAHRDYFAARALLRAPHRIAERLVQARWHEAASIFVTLPEADARVAVEAASRFDLVFAARLLVAGRCDPRAFVHARRQCLFDREAGPAAWREACAALEGVGTVPAAEVLSDVVASRCPAPARIAALCALERMHGKPLPRSVHRSVVRLLARAVRSAVAADDVLDLQAAAVDVVARVRLTGLELVLAQFIDVGVPAPLGRKAHRALRALGVVFPDEVTNRHAAVCERDWAELDAALSAATTVAGAHALCREREALLRGMGRVVPVEWLWRRRFDFDLADVVAEFLPGERIATCAAPDHLLSLAESPDPVRANAAAHRILTEFPERRVELLRRVGADEPRHRLLIAAAAAREPSACRDAERLVHDMLLSAGGDLEPLAAMVCAVFALDRRNGVRLAWTAAAALTDRGVPERLRWPWNSALARCRGGREELDHLLRLGAPDAWTAIDALASFDFHRTAAAGPAWRFSAEARRALMACEPRTTDEAVRWVRAAACAHVVEALPVITALAPQLAGEVVERGGLRRPALVDVLAVVGFLAREAGRGGELLDDHWPDAEDGRAIGSAYLGDWRPAARTALRDPDFVAVLGNALRLWTPGPRTPEEAAGAWIAKRLADHDLALEHHWALADLCRVRAQEGAAVDGHLEVGLRC